jgi:hypothetical protein
LSLFLFDKGIDKGTVLLSIDNGTESWNRDLYETRHGDRALSTRATAPTVLIGSKTLRETRVFRGVFDSQARL